MSSASRSALEHPQALDRTLCATTGRFLAAVHGTAAPLGLGCSLVGVGLWICRPQPLAAAWPWLAGLVALTLWERALALRVHFDAGLFADLAREHPGDAALQALDQALTELKLRAPATEGRDLQPRVQGAKRLAVWHLVVVVTQLIAVTAALMANPMAAPLR